MVPWSSLPFLPGTVGPPGLCLWLQELPAIPLTGSPQEARACGLLTGLPTPAGPGIFRPHPPCMKTRRGSE